VLLSVTLLALHCARHFDQSAQALVVLLLLLQQHLPSEASSQVHQKKCLLHHWQPGGLPAGLQHLMTLCAVLLLALLQPPAHHAYV
jgi:hypothetical protein